MAAPKSSINLLSQDEFSQSPIGTLLLWALSIGRYIVVFTQLVVILSFLSRFKLDRDLTDLNNRINQQQNLVKSYGDLETKVRQVQKRLSFLSDLETTQNPIAVLDTFTTITPPDVRFTQIQVRENQVQISAIALSPGGFSNFVRTLQQNSQFTNLELLNISSGEATEVGIHFDLRATYGELPSKSSKTSTSKSNQ